MREHVGPGDLTAVLVLLDVDALQLGCKAREEVDALLKGEEVLQHGAAPDFARHQAEDARRVGKRAFDAHSPLGLAQAHELDVVADELVVGLLSVEHTPGKVLLAEHRLLEVLDVDGLVEVMHLLAELADRVALVALLVGVVELGEHFGERRVIVDEALEAGDLRDEVRHLGMVLGGRHQEEDRVEVALFGDDTVLAKEARENGGGKSEYSPVVALMPGVVSRNLHGSTKYCCGA